MSDEATKTAPDPKPTERCPACGYCPHCGQSRVAPVWIPAPFYVPSPYYPSRPPYVWPTWYEVTCGGSTIHSIATNANATNTLRAAFTTE